MKTKYQFIFIISFLFITTVLRAQNPVAKFGFNGYGVKTKSTCFIDSSTIFADIVERTWNYGDSPTSYTVASTTTTTAHVYSAAGTYTVKLVVKNNAGFKDSISHVVIIKDLKLPQLHIYQNAMFPQSPPHPGHIELGSGPFYLNKITYCEDTSIYTSSYAGLAYKKWKFYDPSSAPADTSLLQYASNTYTTNPTTIRIVYYYAVLNPAGVCVNGNGSGFALDSIVATGNSSNCPNEFQQQPSLSSISMLTSDSLTPQNALSYTICPTSQLIINQWPCFSCWQSFSVYGQLNSLYSSTSFSNQSAITNYTQSFNPSLPTYSMSFANPGYYSYQFYGQNGFEENCTSQTYSVTVVGCTSTSINNIKLEKSIASYYNMYTDNIMVSCTNNTVSLEKVEIYDIVGNLVFKKNGINNKMIEINASELIGSLFVIKTTTNNGVFINKLIIQK